MSAGAGTIADEQKALVARIGENIQVRRFERFESKDNTIHHYLHGSRIGVMLELEGGDEALGRDLCMHVAASRPICVAAEDVAEEAVAKEREILIAQAKDSGKPQEIIEKMVEGRLRKWLAEMTLLGQSFVKDPDQTVAALLKSHGAKVVRFSRLEVGEGIEKREENFADEVAATVQGT